MAKSQAVAVDTTVADAINTAFGIFQEIRDEVREVVDNAQDYNFANSSRIQTLSDTADTMDGFADEEPDVPESLAHIKITGQRYDKRKPTRSERIGEATLYLQFAIDALQTFIDESAEQLAEYRNEDAEAEAQELLDELERSKEEADNLEFPGQRG